MVGQLVGQVDMKLEQEQRGSIPMQAILEHAEQALQAETHIGPYRLVKPLQQGGMASVYLGYHLHRRVYVAIKVVDGSTAD